jgi:hypothetical protein
VTLAAGQTVRIISGHPDEGQVVAVGERNAFVRMADGSEESWPLRFLRPIDTPTPVRPPKWWLAQTLKIGRPL